MVLSLTAVSAADINATSVSDESSDIDLSSANSEVLKFGENQNFTQLQSDIDNSQNDMLTLNSNYVRCDGENDIVIGKNLTINGNGNTIDAKGIRSNFQD